MVSKAAVIALVAIVAVPILMGYAFNLSEVAVTDYEPDGESVNVTPLLQTDTAYTSARADPYRLNTDFEKGVKIFPIYESKSSNRSSLMLYQNTIVLNSGEYAYWPWAIMTSDFYAYVGNGYNVRFVDLGGNGTVDHHPVNNIVAVHYWHDDNVVEYEYETGSSFYTPYDSNTDWAFFVNNGSSPAMLQISGNFTTVADTYVDLAAGYHFQNIGLYQRNAVLNLPDYTKSVLMTVNLDSITDSNYSVYYTIGSVYLNLQKTTTSGAVSWKAVQYANNQPLNEFELYYNPSGPNVYQILVDSELIGFSSPYYTTNWHTEIRYIGEWPTLFGVANQYIKYEFDWQHGSYADNYFSNIKIGNTSTALATTPIMRVDDAEFRAFAYNIIMDKTYNPSDFKTNPTTTIKVDKFGQSIVFAGNTYVVDNTGNITLGTHKVSVNGLKLESIPTPSGYENRMNGYVISVTAQPSTITFNGQWGASVSTIGNVATTYNKTEWTPGEFAWDGIDKNFLIVGLMVSLGAFIGLAIYSRRSRTALWPLLLVCGGAAMLFLFML